MNIINQRFNIEFSFDIQFTTDLFRSENSLFSTFLKNNVTPNNLSKILMVIDQSVSVAHPQLESKIKQYFKSLPYIELTSILIVKGGEQVKNERQYLEDILQAVNEDGIDRHSYLACIGGGAVLDMVGYAAAIAHRGIRHIRIPTTVLSQNDSGIGVKNSINYFGKKNFLGTFVPPVAVFIDYTFLSTLDDRDWRSGIAEAIKVALIKDFEFFEWLIEHSSELADRQLEPMKYLIYKCADLHNQHIASGDPFESGSARPLDFGHWMAHKLEYLSHFEVRHGEAVAMGIALDTIYSQRIGLISESDRDKVLQLITDIGFKLFHEQLSNPEVLLEGLNEFKEHLGGRLTITLLTQLGRGLEVHEIDEAQMRSSLDFLITNYSTS